MSQRSLKAMTSQEEKLDNAFELIKKGNELEQKEDWWSAADSFGQATNILESLAEEISKSQHETNDSNVEEQTKISELYGRQSFEYRMRGRSCFFEAITSENDKDKSTRDDVTVEEDAVDSKPSRKKPLCLSISEEEIHQRLVIFSSLFCTGKHDVKIKESEPKDVVQQQSSLEERLAELNATLPSGFKTSKERVSDINKGLRRLGVSFYSHKDTTASIELEPSEEEQVQQILSQARDEVRLGIDNKKEGDTEPATKGVANDIDETASEDSSLSGSGTPERTKRKVIRKKLVKAQIHLAQLVALLDEKFQEDSSSDDDESSGDEESGSEIGIDFGNGKSKLIDARKCLDEALTSWTKEGDDNP